MFASSAQAANRLPCVCAALLGSQKDLMRRCRSILNAGSQAQPDPREVLDADLISKFEGWGFRTS